MGATDPDKAAPGSIRRDFGTNIERNAVHGSDSLQTAQHEIKLYFTDSEITSYTRK
jgi:nucleoside-diphosphate kinase